MMRIENEIENDRERDESENERSHDAEENTRCFAFMALSHTKHKHELDVYHFFPNIIIIMHFSQRVLRPMGMSAVKVSALLWLSVKSIVRLSRT